MHKKIFKTLLKQNALKLNTFYMDWCGTCQANQKTGRKKEQERLDGKLVSPVNRKKRQKDKKEKYEKEKIA